MQNNKIWKKNVTYEHTNDCAKYKFTHKHLVSVFPNPRFFVLFQVASCLHLSMCDRIKLIVKCEPPPGGLLVRVCVRGYNPVFILFLLLFDDAASVIGPLDNFSVVLFESVIHSSQFSSVRLPVSWTFTVTSCSSCWLF